MTALTILVVEDEAIVVKWLEKHLVASGYTLAGSAATGAEALEMVSRCHPDLILLDIRLKGPMDGIEVARTVRGQHGIPVIFMTAFADSATIQRANETGPYGYLIKPFDEKSLVSTIESTRLRIGKGRSGAAGSGPDS